MSDDLVSELNSYISAKQIREKNRGAFGWNHTELFRSSGGAKEVLIMFTKKMYDVPPRDICTHYLYTSIIEVEDAVFDDFMKNLCLIGPHVVEFGEDLGDGGAIEADLDSITSQQAVARANSLVNSSTRDQRVQRLREHAGFAKRGLANAVPASVAAEIARRWLDT